MSRVVDGAMKFVVFWSRSGILLVEVGVSGARRGANAMVRTTAATLWTGSIDVASRLDAARSAVSRSLAVCVPTGWGGLAGGGVHPDMSAAFVMYVIV